MSKLHHIMAALAACLLPGLAAAQEAVSLDELINGVFADYTG